MLDFAVGEQGEHRKDHVMYFPNGQGTAVAYTGPITFTRRGPRSAPHKARMFVTARFVSISTVRLSHIE